MSGRRQRKKHANRKPGQQRKRKQVQRNVKDRLSGTLNMYEHQSTYSPNMPVRFLIYLAQEYQTVIEKAERSLYGTGRISLPTPQCVVFYNGTKEMPEEQTLRLSEAFENKTVRADVELTVRMLNINYGYNKRLMEKCRVLEDDCVIIELKAESPIKYGFSAGSSIF